MIKFSVSNCAEFNPTYNSPINDSLKHAVLSDLNDIKATFDFIVDKITNKKVSELSDHNDVFKQKISTINKLINTIDDHNILTLILKSKETLTPEDVNDDSSDNFTVIDHVAEDNPSDYSDCDSSDEINSDYSDTEIVVNKVEIKPKITIDKLEIKKIVTFTMSKLDLIKLFNELSDDFSKMNDGDFIARFKKYHDEEYYNEVYGNFLLNDKPKDIKHLLDNHNFTSNKLDNKFWINLMTLKLPLIICYYEEYCKNNCKPSDSSILSNYLIANPINVQKIYEILKQNKMNDQDILKFFEDAIEKNIEIIHTIYNYPNIKKPYESCTLSQGTDPVSLKYNKAVIDRLTMLHTNIDILYTSFYNKKYIEKFVSKDGLLLKYIKKPTKDIILMAIQQNGMSLQFVPIEFKTKDIILMAVQQNGMSLQFAPDEFKTRILF